MKRILLLVMRSISRAVLHAPQHCLQNCFINRRFTYKRLKNSYIFTLLFLVTCSPVLAQRSGSLSSNGGRFVGFNIDGDTKTGYTKIYPAGMPSFYDFDWFKTPTHNTGPYPYSLLGNGIIDVTDSANLRTRLANGENISFTKRMIGQPYDIGVYLKDYPTQDIDTQFLVDAVYFRDYYANDYTAFTSAAKNGQNPNVWEGGYANTGGKSDIIDVFTHVRTSGINPAKDSAWFFAGVATKNTTGARYFDIEVYREPISFTPSATGTGVKFVSAGTNYGHSRWELNDTGGVTRTGDLIISVEYQSGRAPEIDFRIWLAKSTYDSVVNGLLTPKTFRLNGRWDIANDGLHGYAEITAASSSEVWGSGLGNYTGAANSDTTYSTPWGTVNTSGNWSQNYDQLQFVEIGLNFSRFGMNPFQYVTSYCKSPYASLLVKSRSAPEFNANLDDFVGPVNFTVKEAAPFTVTPEIFSCTNTAPKLNFNFTARNYYRLINSDGDTLAKDVDFRTATTAADRFLSVTQPGTYRIEATNFQGCPSLSTATITIQADTSKPTAAALLGYGQPYYFLNGVGSITGSSFGSSALSYSWTGPTGAVGFPSTLEDPKLADNKPDVVTGDYTLTVTQARNGCQATSMINVIPAVLASNTITLQGKLINGHAQLNWTITDETQTTTYIIERSTNGAPFVNVGHVDGASGAKRYSFIDSEPITGVVKYRIKNIATGTTSSVYSNMIFLQSSRKDGIVISRQSSANRVNIQLNKAADKDFQIKIMSVDGRVLLQQHYTATQGRAIGSSIQLTLPASMANLPVIVAVYQDAYLLEAKKL
jgi:hypothetical protein